MHYNKNGKILVEMQQENVLEMIFAVGQLFEWQEDIWATALCFLLRLFTEKDNGVQALPKSVHCLINTVNVKGTV
jgi:hypothetical protein